MKIFILFLLIFLFFYHHGNCKHQVVSCLERSVCGCEVSDKGGVIIKCDYKQLTQMPVLKLQNKNTIITSISLLGNQISHIPSSAFNISTLERIDLSFNPIQKVDEGAFSGVEKSIKEFIIKNDIKLTISLQELHFNKLENLEKLEISGFKDTFLSKEIFKNLNKLEKVSLTKGFLSSLDFLSFQNSPLSHLDLSHNEFYHLPCSLFKNLLYLKFLSLSLNPISLIEKNCFSNNQKLKKLRLDRSGRPAVEEGAFEGLEGLEEINLALCGLRDEALREVCKIKSLKKVDVSFNHLNSLSLFLDGSLDQLEELILEENQINFLGSSLSSSSLKFLNLERNPIREVEEGFFKGLPSLQTLNLNKVSNFHFHENIFQNQKSSLNKLYLNHLNFSGDLFKALQPLYRLSHLFLSHSNLSSIPPFAFQHTPLKILTLDNNNISHLHDDVFRGLEFSLSELSLANNSLETLNKCLIRNLKKLILLKLNLNNNSLLCNCKIMWLYEDLKKLKQNIFTSGLVTLLPWKCKNEKFIKDLTSYDFVGCHDNTTCQKQTFPDKLLTNVRVREVSSSGFTVEWSVVKEIVSPIHFLCLNDLDLQPVANLTLSPQTTHFILSNLPHSSKHFVFLSTFHPLKGSFQFLNISTSTISWGEEKKITIIISSFLIFFLIFILLSIPILACLFKKTSTSDLPQIRVTQRSKRYVKSMDYQEIRQAKLLNKRLPSNDIYTKDIVKSTIDAMSEEDKKKMAELLTSGYQENGHQGTYEELKGDLYEEIKEDFHV